MTPVCFLPMPPHRFLIIVAIAALGLLAGCSDATPPPALPAPLELTTPIPLPTRRPSPTPRRIESPTPRPTNTVTPTRFPTRDPSQPTSTPLYGPPPVAIDPALLTRVAPADLATPDPAETIIGLSVEGRPIAARLLGEGASTRVSGQTIVLVGAIHGGWEANTAGLMNDLIAYYEKSPAEIAPGIALVLVPVANPDGLALGRDLAGRSNANGVDLNRNWACNWSAEAAWLDRDLDAGQMPFSEPESAALADYLLLNPPAAVIFYHSPGGGVYPGRCGRDHGSGALAEQYAVGTGATLYAAGTHEDRTGSAADWVDGQGIPGLTVELEGWTETDLDRQIGGLRAVQCALVRQAADPASQTWAATRCASE